MRKDIQFTGVSVYFMETAPHFEHRRDSVTAKCYMHKLSLLCLLGRCYVRFEVETFTLLGCYAA